MTFDEVIAKIHQFIFATTTLKNEHLFIPETFYRNSSFYDTQNNSDKCD